MRGWIADSVTCCQARAARRRSRSVSGLTPDAARTSLQLVGAQLDVARDVEHRVGNLAVGDRDAEALGFLQLQDLVDQLVLSRLTPAAPLELEQLEPLLDLEVGDRLAVDRDLRGRNGRIGRAEDEAETENEKG